LDKTAAVVVTYNRKALLGACLESLLAQSHPLDAIYIIDNHSSDGTGAYLRDRGWLDPAGSIDDEPFEGIKAVPSAAIAGAKVEIRYARLPDNTGGAGGFHEGVKRGCADGFDWLWLMDDDLLVTPEALEALVRKRDILTAAKGRSFLLNSLILSKNRMDGDTLAFPLHERARHGGPKIGVCHHRVCEIADKVQDGLYRWACPFNGTLIPTSAIAQIGLPNKDLFIWGDERDFLWRAAKVLDLYTVVDSRAFHPEFPGFAFDWKLYYHVRNSFVVNRHFSFAALRNLKLMATSLGLGLRYGPKGLALMLRAIKDGLTRNLGKRTDLHP
jgi:GT2 family glycosyltransferase